MEFEPFLHRWDLVSDGEPIHTRSSDLLPVRRRGSPAMLKVARSADERAGNSLMAWWQGDGAAAVLEHDSEAILINRAVGGRSLIRMAQSGHDGDATRILCAVAARLHATRVQAKPKLVPLHDWFAALWRAEGKYGEKYSAAAKMARELLGADHDVTVLHGDIHHGNVLDFEDRGWLAIDPKGLLGERTFDFVNIFRNPDPEIALAPGRFARQVYLIAEQARVDPVRLLKWTIALTGLSAAWFLDDGEEPAVDLAVMDITLAELAR
jgi:streptomycin 6-kinase